MKSFNISGFDKKTNIATQYDSDNREDWFDMDALSWNSCM
jgi:hypothetical protein